VAYVGGLLIIGGFLLDFGDAGACCTRYAVRVGRYRGWQRVGVGLRVAPRCMLSEHGSA